jgi:hypothetical protein
LLLELLQVLLLVLQEPLLVLLGAASAAGAAAIEGYGWLIVFFNFVLRLI